MKLMFLRRLGVVLYKNLLLRSTQWFVTTMEVFLPILFVWLVCWSFPSFDCVTDKGPHTLGENIDFKRCPDVNVLFTPNNAETSDVMDTLRQRCRRTTFSPQNDIEELLNSLENETSIGIVFPDGLAPLQGNAGSIKNAVISYTIRMNASEVPSTEKLLPAQKFGDPEYAKLGPNKLRYPSNFLNLQFSLDKVLIEKVTNKSPDFEIGLETFNYPSYHKKFIGSFEFGVILLPLFLNFSVLFMIPTITRNVVAEKQTGIGELMKSAGVSGWVQWMGWMINSLGPMLFTISVCVSLLFGRVGADLFKACRSVPEENLNHKRQADYNNRRNSSLLSDSEYYYDDVRQSDGQPGFGEKQERQREAIMVYSDWALVWFIFFLYICSTIAFCFFICSIIKKPTIATTIAILISVISTFLFMAPVHKVSACLFPNCAITYAYLIILQGERSVLDDSDQPYGAQWDYESLNYFFPAESWIFVNINELSLFQIIMMLVGDICGYFLFALYFENVLPSEHGVRRPWYLFNIREYFESRKRRPKVAPAVQHLKQANQLELNTSADADNQNPSQKDGAVEGRTGDGTETSTEKVKGSSSNKIKPNPDFNSSFEPEVARNDAVGIEIRNIFKNFGSKHAVNGISLRMYTGDIFALLGHNGAGKTTLISMLTGFFSPSKGTAIVDGHDIRFGLGQARERMGLCPQHNMLFDSISVMNHLIIFGMLRGLTLRQAKNEGQSLLLKMNLSDKKSTLSKKLSGGQKRKLSLGMSLIGGTKVVVLDEPTSGMDPQARRQIWDLLLELRGERTILLTTHFMEEADVLGDRIGIMAAGRLQCCGTTAFLKKYYGTGYTLKLTLQQQQEDPSKTSIASNSSSTKIIAVVQKHIPDASIKKDARSDANSSEIFITLPGETATTTSLTQMFSDVNGNKDRLGIQTIGLQQTTMDEVFLRVGELADQEQHVAHKYEWTEDDFKKVPKMKGVMRHVWQFVSLIVKKWIFFKRKWFLLLLEIFIPMVLIVGAIWTVQIYAKKGAKPKSSSSSDSSSPPIVRSNTGDEYPGSSSTQPELLLSLDKYTSPITYYSSHSSSWDTHFEQVIGSSREKIKGDPNKLQGKLAELGENDRRTYKRQMIIAAKSNSTTITGLFNTYPYHSAPLALNVATNIALRAMDPSANNKIQVASHPVVMLSANTARSLDGRQGIPDPTNRTGSPPERNACAGETPDDHFDFELRVNVNGGATLFLLAFILLNCTYIVTPIEEKICNVKQLQLMTGLQPATYWMANFVWDYTVYFMVVLGAVFVVLIIENSSGYLFLSINDGTGVLFLILMCYGFSSIALAYLLSRRSNTVAGGFALVILIHLLSGIIFGFPALSMDRESWMFGGIFRIVIVTLKIVGYFFPTMPALVAIARYIHMAAFNARCYQMDATFPPAYRNTEYLPHILWSSPIHLPTFQGVQIYSESGVGQELFIIILLGAIYVVLLMIFEYGVCNKICRGGPPPPFPPNIYDDDVYQEAERVNFLVTSGEVNTECMVIQNLCKAFGGFAAVSQVNCAVHYGECFGLLGVNGAGKTTMFKMITGEEVPSFGSAYGFGTSIVKSPRTFFSNIGYCPQFDAIIGIFTGREMLELFGVLKGIPFNVSKKEALKWLLRFGLSDSANVPCGKYSGGMKRRLSTAMAMIGDPGLLLLDEPTSGVDPVARHQFWGILEKIRDSGQSIILTSHSMDECEALCSRLGIMVNGQFQCFGGVQHLKTKFAQGYSLTIKLKSDLPFGTEEFEEKMKKFEETINEKFQPCVLKDKHQNLLQYHLQNPSITWDALFKTMEGIKREYDDMIEDYSVNETSLEEVFLAFARMQYPERQVQITTCRQVCTCSC